MVFEAAGAPGLIAQAVNLVRPRGTVLVEGGSMQSDQFVPLIAMVKEVCMQFSAAYALADFACPLTRWKATHLSRAA